MCQKIKTWHDMYLVLGALYKPTFQNRIDQSLQGKKHHHENAESPQKISPDRIKCQSVIERHLHGNNRRYTVVIGGDDLITALIEGSRCSHIGRPENASPVFDSPQCRKLVMLQMTFRISPPTIIGDDADDVGPFGYIFSHVLPVYGFITNHRSYFCLTKFKHVLRCDPAV